MERSTTEIELSISGKKVVLYTYYLRGDRKAIEAVMLESAEFEQVSGKPKLKKVDATYRTKMEDKAVLLAIKKMIDKNGKELEVNIEILDQLPDDDFKKLQDSLPDRQSKKK